MEYYCSTKFTDLQVHLQSRLLYNCCKAYPERISIEWLEKNPGRLFHTDTMLKDRKIMLEDKPCASCDHGCYKYERRGEISARLLKNNNVFISNPEAPIRNLQISLSSDCNLTCAYCSSEWSSSWYKDIKDNGPYNLSDYNLKNDNWSQLWSKIKQKSRSTESKFFKLILKEISLAKHLQKVTILGGEPLLNNQLVEVLQHTKDYRVKIVSGLGVSSERLKTILEKTKNQRLCFAISAESTGKFFEFLRYGVKWNDFLERIDILNDHGVEIEFQSTITNISLFDFISFYEKFSKKNRIILNALTDRSWLMPHVIDEESKAQFISRAEKYKDTDIFKKIVDSLDTDIDDQDRSNLGKFIKEFSNRRNIDHRFFPKHFRNWCNIDA